MKKDVVDYVAKCLTCQKIMAKQQRLGGELTINRGTWVEKGSNSDEFCGMTPQKDEK